VLLDRVYKSIMSYNDGMSLKYDLHSHSTASDGTLSPSELVKHAAEMSVDVLALTDHDTLAGLAEAQQTADELGITLIPGVEISVTWANWTVHIVALGVDPQCQVLRQGLAELQAFRDWRAEEIARRLDEKVGIRGALEGAKALAKGKLVSRTHFARFLLEQGHVKDMQEAFTKYLKGGRPAFVPGQWSSLEDTLGWIQQAGGQAVIAHPARYDFTATKLRRLIGEFIECGGCGLEVVSGSHSKNDYFVMANLAKRFNMLASAGSDYHGPENRWIELGRLPLLPDGCVPVWRDWGLESPQNQS